MNARVLLLVLMNGLFMAAWTGDQAAIQAALARRNQVRAALVASLELTRRDAPVVNATERLRNSTSPPAATLETRVDVVLLHPASRDLQCPPEQTVLVDDAASEPSSVLSADGISASAESSARASRSDKDLTVGSPSYVARVIVELVAAFRSQESPRRPTEAHAPAVAESPESRLSPQTR